MERGWGETPVTTACACPGAAVSCWAVPHTPASLTELCAAFPGSAASSLLRTGDLGSQPRPRCCCLCCCRDSLLPQDVLLAARHFLQSDRNLAHFCCAASSWCFMLNVCSLFLLSSFLLSLLSKCIFLCQTWLYIAIICALMCQTTGLLSNDGCHFSSPSQTALPVLLGLACHCFTRPVVQHWPGWIYWCFWSHYPLSQTSFVWLLHLYLTSYLYWTTVQALWEAFDSTICGDFLRLNESLELE